MARNRKTEAHRNSLQNLTPQSNDLKARNKSTQLFMKPRLSSTSTCEIELLMLQWYLHLQEREHLYIEVIPSTNTGR